jgi:uncharacterized protein HemY
MRDPARALALAQEAVRLAPEVWNYWSTLGMAQYRAGHWKDALAALHKASNLREGAASKDWFFLAMAHQQLGSKDVARKWYDRALAWTQSDGKALVGQNDEMHRFRAEAAELLGLEETPKKEPAK